MGNARTRQRRAQLRRIVIEPREVPGQQPPKRMNMGNRRRISVLRKREQYLLTKIEERRSKGEPVGYMTEEHNALRWAMAIAAQWMAEDGEDVPPEPGQPTPEQEPEDVAS